MKIETGKESERNKGDVLYINSKYGGFSMRNPPKMILNLGWIDFELIDFQI